MAGKKVKELIPDGPGIRTITTLSRPVEHAIPHRSVERAVRQELMTLDLPGERERHLEIIRLLAEIRDALKGKQ